MKMSQEAAINKSKRHSEQMSSSSLLDYDYLVKIVVVGDTGVGKSQLVARFSRNSFAIKSRQTIGVEFATKTIHIENKLICSQIWDTAGEERYRALASAYYRGAVGVLLVYDVSKPRSFKNVAHWLSEIKAFSTEYCQTILVGNKVDLKAERQVATSTGQGFAEKNQLGYIETSALECTNVEAAFSCLINKIYYQNILKSPKSLPLTFGGIQSGQLKVNGKDKRTRPVVSKLKECC